MIRLILKVTVQEQQAVPCTPAGVFGKCHSDLFHTLLPLDMQLLSSKVITTANMKWVTAETAQINWAK